MKKLLVLFAISLSLAACQQEGNPHSPLLPPPDLDEAISVPSGKPILPAYKLPGDFRSGKADQYTDHKDDNPGTYGITNPPTVGSVRSPSMNQRPD